MANKTPRVTSNMGTRPLQFTQRLRIGSCSSQRSTRNPRFHNKHSYSCRVSLPRIQHPRTCRPRSASSSLSQTLTSVYIYVTLRVRYCTLESSLSRLIRGLLQSCMMQKEEGDEKGGGRRFSEFYEKWMAQLEDILHQLLKSINSNKQQSRNDVTSADDDDDEEELESLVSKVTTHQKQYYAAKWAAAHEDVLAFYAPSWLSPLEIAYSWVTGWKPSMAFRVIDSLRKREGSEWQGSEEKVRKMGELRVKIKMEEEKVEREMERQQVAMGDRRMFELARLACRRDQTHLKSAAEDTRVEEVVEVALKGLKSGLEKAMKSADCVRLKTLKGVLDILTPKSKQCVEFLAAACLLQIQLRKWGGKDQIQTCSVNGSTLFQASKAFSFA